MNAEQVDAAPAVCHSAARALSLDKTWKHSPRMSACWEETVKLQHLQDYWESSYLQLMHSWCALNGLQSGKSISSKAATYQTAAVPCGAPAAY